MTLEVYPLPALPTYHLFSRKEHLSYLQLTSIPFSHTILQQQHDLDCGRGFKTVAKDGCTLGGISPYWHIKQQLLRKVIAILVILREISHYSSS